MKKFLDKTGVYFGVAYIILISYLLFVASFRHDTNTSVNLIPFKVLFSDLILIFSANTSWDFIAHTLGNLIGNLLLLVPIPIFFRLNWKGLLMWGFIVLTPITIELLQYILQVGSADIDDVILNAFGGWLAFKMLSKN